MKLLVTSILLITVVIFKSKLNVISPIVSIYLQILIYDRVFVIY
jgi:hypothetical protein